jgi:hypothetical protein
MKNGEGNRLVTTIKSETGLLIEIWEKDFQHALEGHPEVTIERISKALMRPFKVVQSKYSNRACLFYSFELVDDHFGKIYFCVVVGVLGAGKGKLETAYETTFIKKGNVLFERGEGQ